MNAPARRTRPRYPLGAADLAERLGDHLTACANEHLADDMHPDYHLDGSLAPENHFRLDLDALDADDAELCMIGPDGRRYRVDVQVTCQPLTMDADYYDPPGETP